MPLWKGSGRLIPPGAGNKPPNQRRYLPYAPAKLKNGIGQCRLIKIRCCGEGTWVQPRQNPRKRSECEVMGASRIIKMPELSKLDIPDAQCRLWLNDGVIFQDLLNETRTLAVREGPAAKGDYVLAEVSSKHGGTAKLHVELGGRQFPDLEQALMGCRAGQEMAAQFGGEEVSLRVESVKRVVDLPLRDEAVAALKLPGVTSLADYRRQYIRQHGRERALRVFHAIQETLLNRLVELMEVDLDDGEMARFHQQKRIMIQNISGDLDRRLMDAYGGATPEECDRMFFADNRRAFLLYLWGRALAQRDGREPDGEERSQALENFSAIYGMEQEEICRAGLLDEAMQPFYIQYAIGKVRDYYLSQVRFSARDIAPQPLEDQIT